MDPTDQKKDQGISQNSVPNPVGGINKEIETGPVSDYVEISDRIPELHSEVEEIGAEVKRDEEEPRLTPEDIKAGVVKRIPEVTLEPTQPINLPMDQKKAEEEVKKDKNVVNSGLWLANLVLKLFKRRAIK